MTLHPSNGSYVMSLMKLKSTVYQDVSTIIKQSKEFFAELCTPHWAIEVEVMV